MCWDRKCIAVNDLCAKKYVKSIEKLKIIYTFALYEGFFPYNKDS